MPSASAERTLGSSRREQPFGSPAWLGKVLHRRFSAWLERRLPSVGRVRLAHRRIFVVPSPAGWLLGALLFAMLIGSINYQSSLAYAITFWVAGVHAVALLHSYRNLAGMEIVLESLDPGFVGGFGTVHLRITAAAGRTPTALRWLVAGQEVARVAEVGPAGERGSLRLRLDARGSWRLPWLYLESRYPLGLYRVWSPLRLDGALTAFPAPRATQRAPLATHRADDSTNHLAAQAADLEFSGLRAWRLGDTLGRVAWRQSAARDELLVRELDPPLAGQGPVWLDVQHCEGPGFEAALGELCHWVLQLEARGTPYGLRLPSVELRPAVGSAHQRAALTCLALEGRPE